MNGRNKKHERRPGESGKLKTRISPQQRLRLQRALQTQATGNLALAEAELRALLGNKVAAPELFCGLAAICVQTGRHNEAEDLWKRALTIDPAYLEAQMNLAQAYQQSGDIERAATLYRQVVAKQPDLIPAQYLLGNVLKAQGRLTDAAALYQRIIARQPDYTPAHFTYAGIHRYPDATDPHLEAMLGLYQQPGLKNENRIHLAFALAKAYEDIGDYAQAFGYMSAGNDLRQREFDYDIESDRSLIQNIIETFSRSAMSQLQVDAPTSKRPIFIVGMPRSGTSLVEKILASHSEVYGAGELDYMFALGTSRFLSRASGFQYRPLDTYPASTFASVGTTYLEQVALLDNVASQVTDKMPFNMMMIGLIRIALPNARIIHCVRDARDTCLSIYKHNFATGNYRFAYDLRTVAQFYNAYTRLMRHWHDSLPGAIYDIRYESLTANPDSEIRNLLAACELDFEESCRAFDKTDAIVRTASAAQVRQPMYTSSVGLWKKYEKYLQPMLEALDDFEPGPGTD